MSFEASGRLELLKGESGFQKFKKVLVHRTFIGFTGSQSARRQGNEAAQRSSKARLDSNIERTEMQGPPVFRSVRSYQSPTGPAGSKISHDGNYILTT